MLALGGLIRVKLKRLLDWYKDTASICADGFL